MTRPSRELLASPRRLPMVAASILSADFGHLARQCQEVLAAGADLLHVDVMDGHFVPNLSMGPAVCAAVRRACPDATIDVHLMVTDPAACVASFAAAGADHLTFHCEVVSDPLPLMTAIRAAGMSAGVAINPETPLDRLEPAIAEADMLLVMSVHPGFSGQTFIASVLDKARAIRPRLRPRQRLEIDGGVHRASAPACLAAGIDVLVSASALFGAKDYAAEIEILRGGQARVAAVSG